jgi:hypothetical protein
VLDAPASKTVGFLLRDTWVSSTFLKWPVWNKTLKIMICRKCFFQKLTQSSQVHNVGDSTDSNTDGFLSRDTCFSSTQENRPTWDKEPISTLENPSCRKYSFQKLTQFFTGKQCARCFSF